MGFEVQSSLSVYEDVLGNKGWKIATLPRWRILHFLTKKAGISPDIFSLVCRKYVANPFEKFSYVVLPDR